MHPENPQLRLARQAVQILGQGGIMAYPTDAAYALGCAIDNREGLARMLRLRRLPDDHQCTLVCRDLSDLGTSIDNTALDALFFHYAQPGNSCTTWCANLML